ncbi:lipoprotein 17-related variable surface protein [Mycoplasmopsis gallinacea]|uniref:ECM-binding protein homolog n=1 Tax=Mycoplasmopsis gallinacea TaxID=29556 RepID=A0A449A448_9BACT|nr:lipoprotein 17-related variable surface protein [Mycoplasmopsis gallinacea]VEU58992.1 ECM-binding protein homolog [Mycoplasmopsis gallinacea]
MHKNKKTRKIPFVLASGVSLTSLFATLSVATNDSATANEVVDTQFEEITIFSEDTLWTNYANIEGVNSGRNLNDYNFLTPTNFGKKELYNYLNLEGNRRDFDIESTHSTKANDGLNRTSPSEMSTRDWSRFFSVNEKQAAIDSGRYNNTALGAYNFLKWGQRNTFNWSGDNIAKGNFWSGDGFSSNSNTKKFRIGFNLTNLYTEDSNFYGAFWMSNDIILTGQLKLTLFARHKDTTDFTRIQPGSVKTYVFKINEKGNWNENNDEINPYTINFTQDIAKNQANHVIVNDSISYWASLDKYQYVSYYKNVPEDVKNSPNYNYTKNWLSKDGGSRSSLDKILIDSKAPSTPSNFNYEVDDEGRTKFGLGWKEIEKEKYSYQYTNQTGGSVSKSIRDVLRDNQGSIFSFHVTASRVTGEYIPSVIIEFEVKQHNENKSDLFSGSPINVNNSNLKNSFIGAGTNRFWSENRHNSMTSGFMKVSKRNESMIKKFITKERSFVEPEFASENDNLPRTNIEFIDKSKDIQYQLIYTQSKKNYDSLANAKNQNNEFLTEYDTKSTVNSSTIIANKDSLVAKPVFTKNEDKKIWYAANSAGLPLTSFSNKINDGFYVFEDITYRLTDLEKVKRYLNSKKWLTKIQKDKVISAATNVIESQSNNDYKNSYLFDPSNDATDSPVSKYTNAQEDEWNNALASKDVNTFKEFISWIDRLDESQRNGESYYHLSKGTKYKDSETPAFSIDNIEVPMKTNYYIMQNSMRQYIERMFNSENSSISTYFNIKSDFNTDSEAKERNDVADFKDWPRLEKDAELWDKVLKRIAKDSKDSFEKALNEALAPLSLPSELSVVSKSLKTLLIYETIKFYDDPNTKPSSPDRYEFVNDQNYKNKMADIVNRYGLAISTLYKKIEAIKEEKDKFVNNNPDSDYHNIYANSTQENHLINDKWYKDYLKKLNDKNVSNTDSIYRDLTRLDAFINDAYANLKSQWVDKMVSSNGNKEEYSRNIDSFEFLTKDQKLTFKNAVANNQVQNNYSYDANTHVLINKIAQTDSFLQSKTNEAFNKSKKNLKNNIDSDYPYLTATEKQQLRNAIDNAQINRNSDIRFGDDLSLQSAILPFKTQNSYRKQLIDKVNSSTIDGKNSALTQNQKDALIKKIKETTFTRETKDAYSDKISNLNTSMVELTKQFNSLDEATRNLTSSNYTYSTNDVKETFKTKLEKTKGVLQNTTSPAIIDPSSISTLKSELKNAYDALNGDSCETRVKEFKNLTEQLQNQILNEIRNQGTQSERETTLKKAKELNDFVPSLRSQINNAKTAKSTTDYTSASNSKQTSFNNALSSASDLIDANSKLKEISQFISTEKALENTKSKKSALSNAISALNGDEIEQERTRINNLVVEFTYPNSKSILAKNAQLGKFTTTYKPDANTVVTKIRTTEIDDANGKLKLEYQITSNKFQNETDIQISSTKTTNFITNFKTSLQEEKERLNDPENSNISVKVDVADKQVQASTLKIANSINKISFQITGEASASDITIVGYDDVTGDLQVSYKLQSTKAGMTNVKSDNAYTKIISGFKTEISRLNELLKASNVTSNILNKNKDVNSVTNADFSLAANSNVQNARVDQVNITGKYATTSNIQSTFTLVSTREKTNLITINDPSRQSWSNFVAPKSNKVSETVTVGPFKTAEQMEQERIAALLPNLVAEYPNSANVTPNQAETSAIVFKVRENNTLKELSDPSIQLSISNRVIKTPTQDDLRNGKINFTYTVNSTKSNLNVSQNVTLEDANAPHSLTGFKTESQRISEVSPTVTIKNSKAISADAVNNSNVKNYLTFANYNSTTEEITNIIVNNTNQRNGEITISYDVVSKLVTTPSAISKHIANVVVSDFENEQERLEKLDNFGLINLKNTIDKNTTKASSLNVSSFDIETINNNLANSKAKVVPALTNTSDENGSATWTWSIVSTKTNLTNVVYESEKNNSATGFLTNQNEEINRLNNEVNVSFTKNAVKVLASEITSDNIEQYVKVTMDSNTQKVVYDSFKFDDITGRLKITYHLQSTQNGLKSAVSNSKEAFVNVQSNQFTTETERIAKLAQDLVNANSQNPLVNYTGLDKNNTKASLVQSAQLSFNNNLINQIDQASGQVINIVSADDVSGTLNISVKIKTNKSLAELNTIDSAGSNDISMTKEVSLTGFLTNLEEYRNSILDKIEEYKNADKITPEQANKLTNEANSKSTTDELDKVKEKLERTVYLNRVDELKNLNPKQKQELISKLNTEPVSNLADIFANYETINTNMKLLKDIIDELEVSKTKVKYTQATNKTDFDKLMEKAKGLLTSDQDNGESVLGTLIADEITNGSLKNEFAKLNGDQEVAKKLIDNLEFLSDNEKSSFKNKIDQVDLVANNSNSKQLIDNIVESAQNDNTAKEKAFNDINNREPKKLNDSQINEIKKQIKSTDLSNIQTVKNNADTLYEKMSTLIDKASQETANKNSPEYTNASQELKTTYDDALTNAKDIINNRNTSVNKTPQDLINANANVDQVDQLINALDNALINLQKNSASKEIEALENLSEAEKTKYKELIENAESKEEIAEIINKAKKANDEKAKYIEKIKKIDGLNEQEKDKYIAKIKDAEYNENDSNNQQKFENIVTEATKQGLINLIDTTYTYLNPKQKADLITLINEQTTKELAQEKFDSYNSINENMKQLKEVVIPAIERLKNADSNSKYSEASQTPKNNFDKNLQYAKDLLVSTTDNGKLAGAINNLETLIANKNEANSLNNLFALLDGEIVVAKNKINDSSQYPNLNNTEKEALIADLDRIKLLEDNYTDQISAIIEKTKLINSEKEKRIQLIDGLNHLTTNSNNSQGQKEFYIQKVKNLVVTVDSNSNPIALSEKSKKELDKLVLEAQKQDLINQINNSYPHLNPKQTSNLIKAINDSPSYVEAQKAFNGYSSINENMSTLKDLVTKYENKNVHSLVDYTYATKEKKQAYDSVFNAAKELINSTQNDGTKEGSKLDVLIADNRTNGSLENSFANLDGLKQKAIQEINQLSNLNSNEISNLISNINNIDNTSSNKATLIDEIIQKAELYNLAKQKTIVELNKLTDLSDEQLQEYIKQVKDVDFTIDNQTPTPQDQLDEILKNAKKQTLKNLIDQLNAINTNQQDAYKARIENATTAEKAEKILEEAKSYNNAKQLADQLKIEAEEYKNSIDYRLSDQEKKDVFDNALTKLSTEIDSNSHAKDLANLNKLAQELSDAKEALNGNKNAQEIKKAINELDKLTAEQRNDLNSVIENQNSLETAQSIQNNATNLNTNLKKLEQAIINAQDAKNQPIFKLDKQTAKDALNNSLNDAIAEKAAIGLVEFTEEKAKNLELLAKSVDEAANDLITKTDNLDGSRKDLKAKIDQFVLLDDDQKIALKNNVDSLDKNINRDEVFALLKNYLDSAKSKANNIVANLNNLSSQEKENYEILINKAPLTYQESINPSWVIQEVIDSNAQSFDAKVNALVQQAKQENKAKTDAIKHIKELTNLTNAQKQDLVDQVINNNFSQIEAIQNNGDILDAAMLAYKNENFASNPISKTDVDYTQADQGLQQAFDDALTNQANHTNVKTGPNFDLAKVKAEHQKLIDAREALNGEEKLAEAKTKAKNNIDTKYNDLTDAQKAAAKAQIDSSNINTLKKVEDLDKAYSALNSATKLLKENINAASTNKEAIRYTGSEKALRNAYDKAIDNAQELNNKLSNNTFDKLLDTENIKAINDAIQNAFDSLNGEQNITRVQNEANDFIDNLSDLNQAQKDALKQKVSEQKTPEGVAKVKEIANQVNEAMKELNTLAKQQKEAKTKETGNYLNADNTAEKPYKNNYDNALIEVEKVSKEGEDAENKKSSIIDPEKINELVSNLKESIDNLNGDAKLADAKSEAINYINGLNNLNNKQKEALIAEVNNAKLLESVESIKDKANTLDGAMNQLNDTISEAKKQLSEHPIKYDNADENLKSNYDAKLANAENLVDKANGENLDLSEVARIEKELTEAKNALNGEANFSNKKEDLINKIDNDPNLTPSQKEKLAEQVQKAQNDQELEEAEQIKESLSSKMEELKKVQEQAKDLQKQNEYQNATKETQDNLDTDVINNDNFIKKDLTDPVNWEELSKEIDALVNKTKEDMANLIAEAKENLKNAKNELINKLDDYSSLNNAQINNFKEQITNAQLISKVNEINEEY